MKLKKIIIAGGSGFIGQYLVRYFGRNNEIVVLGRQCGDTAKNIYHKKQLQVSDGYQVRYIKWDGKEPDENWAREIDSADLVINLAGKSVNCRYHQKQKNEILDSRINATKVIGKVIQTAKQPPTLWINAASATIYRHSLTTPNDEFTGITSDWKKDNMPYNFIDHIRYKKNRLIAKWRYGKGSKKYGDLELDFSVQVCKLWEHAFFDQETPITRKVVLRTAIILGDGGVITPYLNLCKLGLGGKHGNGRQMYSWVHVEDVARMIEWLYENKKAEGIYNCASPTPVSNDDFMKTLRKAGGNQLGLPAPSWLLEAGAFLIRTETELMLKSRWVIPSRAMHEGFVFKYPILDEALQQIIPGMPRHHYRLF